MKGGRCGQLGQRVQTAWTLLRGGTGIEIENDIRGIFGLSGSRCSDLAWFAYCAIQVSQISMTVHGRQEGMAAAED